MLQLQNQDGGLRPAAAAAAAAAAAGAGCSTAVQESTAAAAEIFRLGHSSTVTKQCSW